MKLGIVSGGFDPIHVGHIRYLKEARQKVDTLAVILNGDSFLIRKKGYNVFNVDERKEILESIKYIDAVYAYESDKDDVSDALIDLVNIYSSYDKIFFFKGGDRHPGGVPIPEVGICEKLGIEIIYGVGGYDKPNSSSWVGKKAIRSLNKE